MLQKNEIVSLEITDLSHEGNGVGKYEGRPVFVPVTAPGDEIVARVVGVRERLCFGILEELKTPSDLRRENVCPAFPRCGGCTLRHINYRAELEYKEKWVRDNLRRIAGIEIDLEPIIPSPKEDRYRNKAQYPVRQIGGRLKTGFFAPRSHRLIPVEDCLLQPEFFGDICEAFTDFADKQGLTAYDELSHKGLLRHLNIRYAEMTGETLVCAVVNGGGIPGEKELAEILTPLCPGPLSFYIGVNREQGNVILGDKFKNVFGPREIRDVLCGVKLRLSPESFYQVNRSVAELLYSQAESYAEPRPHEILLDLYCGIGAIGLAMAGKVKTLIGVEAVESAAADAEANAKENGINNSRFLNMDAAGAAKTLKKEGLKPDIAILDPPRKGADAETLRLLAEMSPSRIIYISCDSATLARDLKILTDSGYKAIKGRTADLFPRTNHVESVVLLKRVCSPR